MSQRTSEKHWYAVYCKNRHERKVHERLTAHGVSNYLAERETRVMWGTRSRRVHKNFLPGYVLVHEQIDPRVYLMILQTEGVVKFVGKPWPKLSWIPDEQVKSLKLLLHAPVEFEEVPFWVSGEMVEVIAGPLAGVSGRVASSENQKRRVVISIDLLQRSLMVGIEAHWLRRAQVLRTPPALDGISSRMERESI